MTEPYDIVVASPFANYDFFAHKMRELCGQWSLTFFMVDEVWVNEFYQKLLLRDISVRVLFDLTANQVIEDDIYLKLAREVKRQGGHVIDDPDTTAGVAHKGHFHQVLLQNRIPVPETILVRRNDLDSFRITDDIKAEVGLPFVVKPAWGDSGVGVIVDGYSEDDLWESATLAPNSDTFLIQKRLRTKRLGNHSSWFRTFHVCGEVILCWWDPLSHEYHLVRPGEVKRYRLHSLQRIVRGIARVSRMKKFSSEICLHQDGKFYAVDYVNADPDMNPKSFYDNGVPDEVVRHIVWLLFHEAMRLIKRRQGFFDEYLNEAEEGSNWLEQRKIEQLAPVQ
jgi:hypothetical protein